MVAGIRLSMLRKHWVRQGERCTRAGPAHLQHRRAGDECTAAPRLRRCHPGAQDRLLGPAAAEAM